MSGIGKRLSAFGRSRQHGWKIADVEAACRNFGLDCHAPTHGAHYVVSHPQIAGLLTIPAKRPIKPIYVKLLTEMISSAEQA